MPAPTTLTLTLLDGTTTSAFTIPTGTTAEQLWQQLIRNSDREGYIQSADGTYFIPVSAVLKAVAS